MADEAALTLRDDGCPICDSRNVVLLGGPGKVGAPFRRFPDVRRIQIARCSECAGMYVHPMTYFSDGLQKELYNIQYFHSDGALQEFKNLEEKERILEIAQRVSRGSLKGKTMLDIGCGTGEFLVTGAKFGMTVTGTDVEPSITRHVQEVYGFRVITGIVETGLFPPESFDVIVLSHVIEHVQKPLELLRAIHNTLKRSGLFVMCTPNADSLMEVLHDIYGRIRYDRSKSYRLSPFTTPYHIVGFNPTSSRRILERAGFTPAYCRVHSGLEWEDPNRKLVMRSIKVAGAALRKGMSIVTVSRKR